MFKHTANAQPPDIDKRYYEMVDSVGRGTFSDPQPITPTGCRYGASPKGERS